MRGIRIECMESHVPGLHSFMVASRAVPISYSPSATGILMLGGEALRCGPISRTGSRRECVKVMIDLTWNEGFESGRGQGEGRTILARGRG